MCIRDRRKHHWLSSGRASGHKMAHRSSKKSCYVGTVQPPVLGKTDVKRKKNLTLQNLWPLVSPFCVVYIRFAGLFVLLLPKHSSHRWSLHGWTIASALFLEPLPPLSSVYRVFFTPRPVWSQMSGVTNTSPLSCETYFGCLYKDGLRGESPSLLINRLRIYMHLL